MNLNIVQKLDMMNLSLFDMSKIQQKNIQNEFRIRIQKFEQGIIKRKQKQNKKQKQMQNPITHQSALIINTRQRQLQLQNSRLKHQLKSSHHTIQKLQNQIQDLKNTINYLKQENNNFKKQLTSHQRNYPHNNQNPLPVPSNPSNLRRSPNSKSSLKLSKDFRQQLEVFTSQSDSDNFDDFLEDQDVFESMPSVIHPLGKSNKNTYFQENSIILGRRNTNDQPYQKSQIKLNSGKKHTPRSLKKIDSTKLFRQSNYFDIDQNDQENSAFSSVQSQLSPLSSNLTKSQKLIPNQNSIIKTEGRIKEVTSPQKVFKKVSIGKPIFDLFFVTGIGSKGSPQIIYSYPKQGSEHFQAILSICYSQQMLRMKEGNNIHSSNNNSSSKNLLNNTVNSHTGSHRLKEFYIIPLRKLNADTENERQYLTICEVEEVILVPRDNILIPCVFQRMYCFISSQQFFVAYRNLVNQFLDKINHSKMSTVNSRPFNTQEQYKISLKECLEQPLSILAQKSAESNHTLSYKLDQFVSISIDIPSVDNSFKLVGQYKPWGVMNFKVQVRPVQQYINPLQMKLFGILLTYVLCQKKVVLFSISKSKVSQCILHLLQIIKPLQYVCPIIMTVLKQEHQEYFSAPMSLILGLWTEQKKLQKQKIQIFMNRKQNLAGQIEKGKTHIQNGIVINLDTGLVYGDGLSEALTSTALTLNQYYENFCHHLKDVFKLFEKLFGGKDLNRDETELIQIKHKMQIILKETQLWTYFKERQGRKPKFIV